MKQDFYKALNWDEAPEVVVEFWEQNLKQFWIDTEFVPSKDVSSWKRMTPVFRDTYSKILGGLTLLDTLQSNVGMARLINHVEDFPARCVISFMSMMETIHAKSYSTIFTTLLTKNEINDVFDWIHSNEILQRKARLIDEVYELTNKKDLTDEELFKVYCASINLESHLFYSGFFLPVYIEGLEGELTGSADIIKKIVADESIHGGFIGYLARNLYDAQSEDVQKLWYDWLVNYSLILHENEIKFIEEVYAELDLERSGIINEVKDFLKYNMNRGFMNLGFEPYWDVKEINPIVMNGIDLLGTQHDFFSKKSTNYLKDTSNKNIDYDEIFN